MLPVQMLKIDFDPRERIIEYSDPSLSQCSLKNAPPAGDFHWLMLQFWPFPRTLCLIRMRITFATHHIDVLQK